MKIFTLSNGFVQMTREYVGGIIAGFGLCAITMKFLVLSQGPRVVETHLLLIAAFFLIAVGGMLALSGQRRLEAERTCKTSSTPVKHPQR